MIFYIPGTGISYLGPDSSHERQSNNRNDFELRDYAAQ